jgi:hypothetical protein
LWHPYPSSSAHLGLQLPQRWTRGSAAWDNLLRRPRNTPIHRSVSVTDDGGKDDLEKQDESKESPV